MFLRVVGTGVSLGAVSYLAFSDDRKYYDQIIYDIKEHIRHLKNGTRSQAFENKINMKIFIETPSPESVDRIVQRLIPSMKLEFVKLIEFQEEKHANKLRYLEEELGSLSSDLSTVKGWQNFKDSADNMRGKIEEFNSQSRVDKITSNYLSALLKLASTSGITIFDPIFNHDLNFAQCDHLDLFLQLNCQFGWKRVVAKPMICFTRYKIEMDFQRYCDKILAWYNLM